MTAYPIYQVDAFSSDLFGGNPAAICPLQEWLPDELMQKLAAENNLSETAFVVPYGEDFEIRWFTPGTEVSLCGHATLASAFVYFNYLGYNKPVITFHSKSGPLLVSKNAEGKITLDFPSNPPENISSVPEGLFSGLGIREAPVYITSFDHLVVLPSQADVEALKPDFKTLAQVKVRGVICTAKGEDADFVSRCFYPQSGIDEDPVTGSAHTIMVPYWANILGKTSLKAIQLSARRGVLECELSGNRVKMSGYGILYMKGEYYL